MDKSEIIERLKRIASHAVHTVGERPFVMSLDDGIAVHEAIELLTNCPEIPDSCNTETVKAIPVDWLENFIKEEANKGFESDALLVACGIMILCKWREEQKGSAT